MTDRESKRYAMVLVAEWAYEKSQSDLKSEDLPEEDIFKVRKALYETSQAMHVELGKV